LPLLSALPVRRIENQRPAIRAGARDCTGVEYRAPILGYPWILK
jgi:hypothetical protein